MSARPILVDTTRLLTRLGHESPTGIDRVDLAYARRFLNGRAGNRAVALTRFGARTLPDRRLRDLLGAIDRRWSEDVPADADPVLAAIRRRLAGGEPGPPPAPKRRIPVWREFLRRERFSAGAFAWGGMDAVPRGAVYLHTSHLRLDRPRLFGWLDSRPDVRPVFFVHDLIPIDYPEYVVPGEDGRHRVRMATVAARAAAVLVNSADVGARLSAFLTAERLRVPPIAVAPLGVEPSFRQPSGRVEKTGRPYFVACSTIEARKNHLLLLQVWRELAGAAGSDPPALVIVGRRGWESEAAADMLDRCAALRGHVFETTGLSTSALADLVRGARGLLMPSFAEGYGIPVVEALALGTPVLASDIGVFREIAGPHATYLHPLDGPGWRDAVLRLGRGPAPRIDGPAYDPPTWGDHFAIVDGVLAAL